MTTVHTAATGAERRPAAREVDVLLRYDDVDVERAAERAGVELSPAERDAILLMLDDDVARLVREGFEAALSRFVRRELQVVAAGHRASEDD